jgi:hypothetical protein
MGILVGDFDENDLKNGVDKKALQKKKEETGLKYANSKIIKKGGKTYLRLWVCSVDEFEI